MILTFPGLRRNVLFWFWYTFILTGTDYVSLIGFVLLDTNPIDFSLGTSGEEGLIIQRSSDPISLVSECSNPSVATALSSLSRPLVSVCPCQLCLAIDCIIHNTDETTGLLLFLVPGHEVTYQGHAGVGRPIPAPLGSLALYSAPRKTPQNVDRLGQGEDQPDLILPKKVRGTPTMYADLQFPKSSNFGSMKRKGRGDSTQPRHLIHPKDTTEYAKIKFSPKLSERAELWGAIFIMLYLSPTYFLFINTSLSRQDSVLQSLIRVTPSSEPEGDTLWHCLWNFHLTIFISKINISDLICCKILILYIIYKPRHYVPDPGDFDWGTWLRTPTEDSNWGLQLRTQTGEKGQKNLRRTRGGLWRPDWGPRLRTLTEDPGWGLQLRTPT